MDYLKKLIASLSFRRLLIDVRKSMRKMAMSNGGLRNQRNKAYDKIDELEAENKALKDKLPPLE